MKSQAFLLSAFAAVIFYSCTQSTDATMGLIYPETRKSADVDTYFGTEVPDPYRWLENDTSTETAQWVAAQNKVTFDYLGKIPFRDRIRKRLEEVYNYERLGEPSKEGDYYYFYKNDGLQNHSVLYRKRGASGAPEVFLDPNKFSADGTTGLSGVYFTRDGSKAAYLITDGGSDWRKGIVVNTGDVSVIEDTLSNLKFTGIAWRGNEGFYYSSYDKPEGSELSAKTQYHKVYFHKLGTRQSEDQLIFGGEQQPRRYVGAGLTEDERFLIVQASTSTSGNELYVQDLSSKEGSLRTIVSNFDNNHSVIDHDGRNLIIFTNLNAPNYRVVLAPVADPSPANWKDLIPESSDVIQSVSAVGKNLFVEYLKDARSMVLQFDYAGKLIREIELPGIGSVSGFNGKADETETYYTFTSFTYPPTVFRFDIASGKSEVYAKPKVDFNPEDYETKQIFYQSKDGTKVPMFIVYKKGLKPDGTNPTLLYAYGGFNVSMTPAFNTSRVVWLENGGVFAQPNLRGGGEYGEEWHLAGTKMQKQNVFDDFIAAAEYLINEGYTTSGKLAISGGSNGGLLVGATMTQRPDLAKVALPAVGVMDMLRYHTFTAGAGWAYDYGTSEDSKEMFEYLHAYSPVHALKKGTSYPATLVTTADHDDRVVPAHSFKFAATLQECHDGTAPVLIRIETKSGHSSSNLSKTLEITADQYAFAWYAMGAEPTALK